MKSSLQSATCCSMMASASSAISHPRASARSIKAASTCGGTPWSKMVSLSGADCRQVMSYFHALYITDTDGQDFPDKAECLPITRGGFNVEMTGDLVS
jgi:hypothetical protein